MVSRRSAKCALRHSSKSSKLGMWVQPLPSRRSDRARLSHAGEEAVGSPRVGWLGPKPHFRSTHSYTMSGHSDRSAAGGELITERIRPPDNPTSPSAPPTPPVEASAASFRLQATAPRCSGEFNPLGLCGCPRGPPAHAIALAVDAREALTELVAVVWGRLVSSRAHEGGYFLKGSLCVLGGGPVRRTSGDALCCAVRANAAVPTPLRGEPRLVISSNVNELPGPSVGSPSRSFLFVPLCPFSLGGATGQSAKWCISRTATAGKHALLDLVPRRAKCGLARPDP